jgi:hypothetical protein
MPSASSASPIKSCSSFCTEAEKPQAAEIYVAHRMQNATFDPQGHGFVLTVPEIEAYIHRLNLKNPQVIAEMARHQRAKAA